MKFKLIAIVTVIILLVMSGPVYADTLVPEPPSDAWEYWAISASENYDVFFCWSSHNPITVKYDQYGSLTLKLVSAKYFKYEDGNWVLQSKTNYGTEYGYIRQVVASNHDIAWDDGSGFFFLRPKVTPLSQTMKETDFGTIWRTFSVGLIPIVGLIILAMSLRKAWAFFRGQLTS